MIAKFTSHSFSHMVTLVQLILFIYFLGIQLKHPSALDTFEQMTSIANGRQIVVFLDYDGTLSNIVDNTAEAFMNNTVNILHIRNPKHQHDDTLEYTTVVDC